MINVDQYFGDKNHQDGHTKNAHKLIGSVNSLLHFAECDGGYVTLFDPDTGTQISGSKGGAGDGGYRDDKSRTGAARSTHRFGQGIDIYDPDRVLSQWCVHNKHKLSEFHLWIEDPRYTPVWTHFQCVPPKSGKLIYIPSMSAPLAPALEGQKAIPFEIK